MEYRVELPFTETGRLQVKQVCTENKKFDFEYSKFLYPNQDSFELKGGVIND